jgi:hypothetical protein
MTTTDKDNRIAELEDVNERLRVQVRALTKRIDELRQDKLQAALRELREAHSWSRPRPQLDDVELGLVDLGGEA